MYGCARRLGCSLAIVAAAACGAAAPASPTSTGDGAAPAMRRLVVLGDSLAVSPSQSTNFVAELQKRLETAALNWVVTNRGVSGDTTSQGLSRFDIDVPHDTSVLVLELGANDGLRGVSIATIERNLSTVMERAQSRGIGVLLCGMETPPVHGWNYSVEFHNLFPRLAQRYAVRLVPFLLSGVALEPDMNGDDGIHPNAAGARHIADTIWPYLEPLVMGQQAVVLR
jgi:acyl-CoA thioesterase I